MAICLILDMVGNSAALPGCPSLLSTNRSRAACRQPTEGAEICSLKSCCPLLLGSVPYSDFSLAPLGLAGSSALSDEVLPWLGKVF